MKCPTLDEWAALASGQVTDESLHQLVEHLDSCASCEELMKRWPASAPSFMPSLKDLESPPDQRLIDRLCQDLAIADVTSAREQDSSVGAAADQPLKSFGPYELHELLGRGGMGEVYRAWHRHLRRFVAIKFLSLTRLADAQMQRRFAREMAVIAAVDHPHVVRALDAGIVNGRQYLVMEWIDGEDAASLVRRQGPLSIANAADIVRQAALGLEAIQQAGLVHRDIKPSNLFVSRAGVAKVLDLGLARSVVLDDQESELTASRQILGTLDYIAPEQIDAQAEVDIRADIYSLGCTLYYLLAGRAPFSDHKGYAKLSAHGSLAPPALTKLRADVPAEMLSLLEDMLAKSPAERISSPAEVAARLLPFVDRATLPALVITADEPAKTAIWAGNPSAGRSRVRWLAAVGIVLPIGLLAASPWIAGALPLGDSSSEREPDESHRPGPQLALGKVDAPQPLAWYNLLQKRPEEVFWPHGVGPADWHFNEQKQTVFVNAPDQGVLKLGTAEEPYYKLRFGFHQNDWTGGLGVILGMQRTVENETPVMHYELIVISPIRMQPPEFGVFRHRGAAYYAKQGRYHSTDEMTHAAINMPVGQQMLELEVRQNALFAVRLNGIELPDLVDAKRMTTFTPLALQGDFGIYAHGADGTIMDAHFMLLPEER